MILEFIALLAFWGAMLIGYIVFTPVLDAIQ
jgi:hypothetical protein